MPIICPNCQTSYAVTAAALGASGRNVRCAKCKEVWLAKPEEAALVPEPPADTDLGTDDEAAFSRAHGGAGAEEADAPMVESPPIAHDGWTEGEPAWLARARQADLEADAEPLLGPRRSFAERFAAWRSGAQRLNLSAAIAAMAALVIGLMLWRTDIVRLLPQTATFFRLAGAKVNLRNLGFEQVHVSSETVNGAPVMIIEGALVPIGLKPVEIPRLRFVVRDERGTPIYTWNMVPDQAVLQPGEKLAFKSRLASPPPNAHEVIVRFFNKRDLASPI